MNALKGKILAITRSEEESEEFSRLVKEEGGTPISLPTIQIIPKGRQVSRELLVRLRTKKHDYCAFMSPHAVRVLFDMSDIEDVLGALRDTMVIAVGPKTRAALEGHGVKVGLMPEEFSSCGLVDMLSSMSPSSKKIIIPRSEAADKYVASALETLGMEVEEFFLYTIKPSEVSPVWQEFYSLLRRHKVAGVVFTSASSVDSFFRILGGIAQDRLVLDDLTSVISIGPLTSSALRGRSLEYHEARVHTVKGAFDLAIRFADG
ncbi:MAG TPA: uroporphyrinogen-III synthase [Nitrososphaera sp.]|nr:uroporphyrinogen-III synthase [Nitrososphaera sp.]